MTDKQETNGLQKFLINVQNLKAYFKTYIKATIVQIVDKQRNTSIVYYSQIILYVAFPFSPTVAMSTVFQVFPIM